MARRPIGRRGPTGWPRTRTVAASAAPATMSEQVNGSASGLVVDHGQFTFGFRIAR